MQRLVVLSGLVDGEQHEEAELRHACSLLATIGHAVSGRLCTAEAKVEREGRARAATRMSSPLLLKSLWGPIGKYQ